jgi:chromosome partitioning protein
MSVVIAIANQKGGVGKTTTVANLAGALAEAGRRVLAVDMDSQGSLGVGFGLDVGRIELTIYDVLVKGYAINAAIHAVRDAIDIVPANINLSSADQTLAALPRREDRLRAALAPVRDRYDFIVIDCPPSPGLLTINALAAADGALIPLACDYHSMVGVALLVDTIRGVQAGINPALAILGILPTRYDSRTIHAGEVLATTRERLAGQVPVLDIVIPETVRLKEAPIVGQTILEYRSSSPAAAAYRRLAQELIHHGSTC